MRILFGAARRFAFVPERGAIGLLTVIILGATVLAVGLAASRSLQTELLTVGDSDRGQNARQLSSSCLEEALLRLKADHGYLGGAVPLGGLSCQVAVSGSGPQRTLIAEASEGESTRILEATVEFRESPGLQAGYWHVVAWQETDL